MRQTKQILTILASAGTIGVFVVDLVKQSKRTRRKLNEIQYEKEKDLIAIGRASGKVEERLDNGKYRTITEAMNDLDQEIEFQKITRRL